jgi:hypothetical protein
VRVGRLAAGLAAAVLVAPGAAGAALSPVALPSTRIGLTPVPPLPAGSRLLEQRIPGAVSSRQTVLVGVSASGTVQSVRVAQRLVLRGLGDYVFAVGAPALSVRRAAGSGSEPGLRHGAVLWQGFSAGRRVLAADVELRPGAAAAALPLRVSRAGGRLLLENTTAVTVTAFGGTASAAGLAAAVRELLRAAATGGVADGLVVSAAGVRPSQVRVEAPLEVEGQVGGRRFRAVLGAGNPLRLEVSAGASLALTVRPFLPAELLQGRPTLARTVDAALRLARVRQYTTFLRNPDPVGPARAVYRYRIVLPAAPAPTAGGSGADGGWSPLGIAAAAGLGLASFAGLLVLWARS